MRQDLAAVLCALGAAIGCGGASGDVGSTTGGPLVEEEAPRQPVRASGANEAEASVGAAGGTLSLGNGARLDIPAGALASDTSVSFAVGADGQAFGDAERQRPLGPMLQIEPTMVAQGGDAFEVSIPQQPIPEGFAPADLAFAMEEEGQPRAIDTLGTQTRWQFYPVLVENNRFVARMQGFAGHRVRFGVAR